MNQNESGLVVLAERYDKNPILKGLVQLTPFGLGGVFDAAITTELANMRAERMKQFFDQLNTGKVELTEDLIKSNDFIHAYFSVLNSVIRTKRKEKIILFANLLSSSLKNEFYKSDEYEEYLTLLENMSYREICVLTTLAKYEKENPIEDQKHELKRTHAFWKNFLKEASEICNAPEEEITAITSRLIRTGCYIEFTGYMDFQGGMGKLTSTYYRLESYIKP